MQPYVNHLVRRGVDFTNAVATSRHDDKVDTPKIPGWGIALVYATIVAAVVFTLGLEYTLSDVLGTLTMIETPTTAIALPSSEEEADKKDTVLEQLERVPLKPITSRIRTSVQHITAIGGRWARWRAIVPAMIYSFVVFSASQIISSFLPRFVGSEMVSEIMATVICARIHMAWTHAIISMPSSLRWYQRLGSVKSVKKLWIPSAVNVIASYAAVYLTIGFALLVGACNSAMFSKKGDDLAPHGRFALFALQGLAVEAFSVAMSLLILLPSAVTLARVEASLLPEDQETIVPFDRSFGGKVVPEVLGGTGAIGFIDAWRTFDWEARRRVVKLYLKIFLIMIAVTIALAHVVLIESWAIMGSELVKLGTSVSKNSMGQL